VSIGRFCRFGRLVLWKKGELEYLVNPPGETAGDWLERCVELGHGYPKG